jgi:pyruvate ferredoxin oxidoreductase delta subunit
MSWKAIPDAGVILRPKTSLDYKTGAWRTRRPVLDRAKCTNCLICWIYCPEPAIVRGEKTIELDYDFCKGCGICATECPTKAFVMEDEPE